MRKHIETVNKVTNKPNGLSQLQTPNFTENAVLLYNDFTETFYAVQSCWLAKYISTYLYIGIVLTTTKVGKNSFSQLGNIDTLSPLVYKQLKKIATIFIILSLPFFANRSPGRGRCFITSCKVMSVSTGTRCNELCPCSCLIAQAASSSGEHTFEFVFHNRCNSNILNSTNDDHPFSLQKELWHD